MLANPRIARSRPVALALILFSALGAASKSLAQSTLPPMPAADAPIIDYQNRYLPAYGRTGMVVSPEKLAGEIGLDMLKQGGNAVDAAVATGFALAVTLPRAGNIGGGGFMLIHLAETDEQIFIDYRETAPAAATRDMFLKEDGSVDQAKGLLLAPSRRCTRHGSGPYSCPGALRQTLTQGGHSTGNRSRQKRFRYTVGVAYEPECPG